jgi:predicted nucleotidyltransferase
MTLDSIVKALEAESPVLRERFSLRRLAVFGSVARGTESETSDVDILVEFEHEARFDEFMDLRFHLEDLLGVRIDLVTEKAIRPGMRESIEREAIRVA